MIINMIHQFSFIKTSDNRIELLNIVFPFDYFFWSEYNCSASLRAKGLVLDM